MVTKGTVIVENSVSDLNIVMILYKMFINIRQGVWGYC